MTRRSPIPQSRRHIMVYDDDWAVLLRLYGGSIGAGTAAKKIIRAWRLRIEAKVGRSVTTISKAAGDDSP